MVAFAVLLVLAIIPAAIAADKGRSFLGWYVYGVLLLPVAIVHALLAPPDRAATDRR